MLLWLYWNQEFPGQDHCVAGQDQGVLGLEHGVPGQKQGVPGQEQMVPCKELQQQGEEGTLAADEHIGPHLVDQK